MPNPALPFLSSLSHICSFFTLSSLSFTAWTELLTYLFSLPFPSFLSTSTFHLSRRQYASEDIFTCHSKKSTVNVYVNNKMNDDGIPFSYLYFRVLVLCMPAHCDCLWAYNRTEPLIVLIVTPVLFSLTVTSW